jgi:hypothetical protein
VVWAVMQGACLMAVLLVVVASALQPAGGPQLQGSGC